jgi:hypothetical protein
LANSLVALRRVDEAVEATRERVKLWPGNNPDQLYEAACAFALCIPSAGVAARKRAVADEAMGALRTAVAAGYTNAAWMSRDTDLLPLHDRADFRALVSELFDRTFPADPFAR